MQLTDVVRILRRNFLLIVAAMVLGVALGALSAMLTPPRYQATAELYVKVQLGSDAGPAERAQGQSYVQQVMETYRTISTSSLVLQPAIDALGLDLTVEELAARVTVSVNLGTTVVTVSASDDNPAQAARVTNAVANSFSNVVTNQLESREQVTSYEIQIRVLQQAEVPLAPAAPNMRNSLLLGGVAGLAAGVGIGFLRSTLDTRVRTRDDIERAVPTAPVLGTIAFDPDAAERPLVVASAPKDPRAEAFRALRTNVRFLFTGDTGVFVITSAGPGEGKSTTGANLAVAFAEANHRVVLIDADLRKPRVADYFGIEGGVGLSDVLAGRIGVADALQHWGRGALFLLPSGAIPPNPSELLGSDAMSNLIETLATSFDIIIIDAPPILLVTDAAVVSRLTTGVLLVSASGITRAPRLHDAARSIETADGKILGTILTMAPTRGADKTAYGAYAYGAAQSKD